LPGASLRIPTPIGAAAAAVEPAAIFRVRTHSVATPFWRIAVQVVPGGIRVPLAGIFIGGA
jgi:hypothetical protein